MSPGLARDVCRHLHKAGVIEGSVALDDATYIVVVSARRCGDGVLLRPRTSNGRDEGRGAAGARASSRAGARDARRVARHVDRVRSAAPGRDDRLNRRAASVRAGHGAAQLAPTTFQAISALKTAVALDPQFALAYAQLGSAYSNTGDTTNAKPYLRKAFELRDRATEPERLYITGRYFDIVTGELEKAAETYRLWTRMYPGEWLGVQRVGQ